MTFVATLRRAVPEAWVNAMPVAFGISLGLVEADPLYAGRIRAAQVAGIIRLTPLVMIASCLNALILLVTLAHTGALRPSLLVWAGGLFALALHYGRGWVAWRKRDRAKSVSRRAIRRAILHGTVFGAIWGLVPAMVFPTAVGPMHLLIGCLTAGMMCAGGFVLATVPLAGAAYVGMMMLGSSYALLAAGVTAIHLSLMALMFVYAAVIVTNLTWHATLFVGHFLVEARLHTEIAAREKAQGEVAHAQRMTALGELAGGIAHDFNNILQGIAGSAALIARHPGDAEKIRKLTDRVLDSAERGGAITRRLLGFARQDTLNAEPVDVWWLLHDTADLLRDAFDPSIAIHVAVAPDLPRMLVDKAQLEVILVNLAANARDAMPDGGVITLRAVREVSAAGATIRICSQDTGAGMDAVTLARAAEPFFTTKPKGRGTGLGLSMAKGFAEQSHGAFAISSAPGDGTTVTLWLPATDLPAAAVGEVAFSTGGRPFGPCHVLVVDDDVHVRETMVMSLAGAGFVMSGAEDAPQALRHIDRGARVDALITDFLMPGINGVQLIQAAQARRPGLPAILLTGHVGDVAALPGALEHDGRFILLQKPIRPEQLAARLSAAIQRVAA